MAKKASKTATTFVHWIVADPYDRMVCSITGDLSEGLRQLESCLRWKGFRDDVYDDMAKDLPRDNAAGRAPFCRCGRTCITDKNDVVMWFPRFPSLPILVHELEHAKDFVLNSAGVRDTEGEADAYLLAFLMGHFLEKIGDDIKRKMPKARWI